MERKCTRRTGGFRSDGVTASEWRTKRTPDRPAATTFAVQPAARESRDRRSDSHTSRDRREPSKRGSSSTGRRDAHDARAGGHSGSRSGPPRRDAEDFYRNQRMEPRHPPADIRQEIPKKTFTTRCRLFVGNLPNEVNEEECRKMFQEFGTIGECFLSGKGIRFRPLPFASRPTERRFVCSNSRRPVSNEVLYNTFSMFGEVERAVHVVDERGKPTGEGVVEFERKAAALDALRQIEDRVFILALNTHPLRAGADGKPGRRGRSLGAHGPAECGPQGSRHSSPFADEKSFEFSYGMRWKELYQFEKSRREQLDAELRDRRRQLEADMELEFEDFRAERLRLELEERKRELERLEARKGERGRHVGRPQFDEQPWAAGGPSGNPYDERSLLHEMGASAAAVRAPVDGRTARPAGGHPRPGSLLLQQREPTNSIRQRDNTRTKASVSRPSPSMFMPPPMGIPPVSEAFGAFNAAYAPAYGMPPFNPPGRPLRSAAAGQADASMNALVAADHRLERQL
ncbi:hypothetical protein M3Y99_01450000 [Aphelenchoides fujianensis]|nr:hypothetical protein M3Y99_01450000 [Aphelenchoides fujianensis]